MPVAQVAAGRKVVSVGAHRPGFLAVRTPPQPRWEDLPSGGCRAAARMTKGGLKCRVEDAGQGDPGGLHTEWPQCSQWPWRQEVGRASCALFVSRAGMGLERVGRRAPVVV